MGSTAAAALLAVVLLSGAGAGPPEDPVLERGRYLVEAVMACDSCHTPRGAEGLDMTRRFSGGTEVWDTPAFTVRGSNITGDAETGIGSWSDADLKRLMVEGLRPDGVPVAAQMPWTLYRALTPEDLDAVVRFVRSVKPIRNAVPPPTYKTEAYAAKPGSGPRTAPADGPAARGAYLGSLAYCMACHARRPDGVVDPAKWQGRGGFRMAGSWGAATVPNITSHKVEGVGGWSDAELRRALVEGVGRDGRRFALPMARQAFYRRMIDADVAAIVAWMRAIPPSE